MRSKNKKLVLIGKWYGIFYIEKIMALLYIKVKDIPSKAGTKEKILIRYGLPPYPSPTG